ncbi:MAG: hypothetical protein AB2L26_13325 [Ignavibacteria bacterium]
MEESNNVIIFKNAAEEILARNYIIKTKTNLYYELFFKNNLETSVANGLYPKRGYSAFQTDLCIFEKVKNIELPRIVIECKPGLTTHDILTYSTKAGKHKTVYPSLRYGLYVSNLDKIPGKFFIHNEHIDFFIAGKAFKGIEISKLAKQIIKKEISISKTLDTINFKGSEFNYFHTDIILRNI